MTHSIENKYSFSRVLIILLFNLNKVIFKEVEESDFWLKIYLKLIISAVHKDFINVNKLCVVISQHIHYHKFHFNYIDRLFFHLRGRSSYMFILPFSPYESKKYAILFNCKNSLSFNVKLEECINFLFSVFFFESRHWIKNNLINNIDAQYRESDKRNRRVKINLAKQSQ